MILLKTHYQDSFSGLGPMHLNSGLTHSKYGKDLNAKRTLASVKPCIWCKLRLKWVQELKNTLACFSGSVTRGL